PRINIWIYGFLELRRFAFGQEVNAILLRFAVELQPEPLREESLEHLALLCVGREFDVRRVRFARFRIGWRAGVDIERIVVHPCWRVGENDFLLVEGLLDDVKKWAVDEADSAARVGEHRDAHADRGIGVLHGGDLERGCGWWLGGGQTGSEYRERDGESHERLPQTIDDRGGHFVDSVRGFRLI